MPPSLKQKPDEPVDLPMSLATRAYDLHAEQRDDEATRCINQALALEPELVGALYLKGEIARAHGDYVTGWPLYELRHYMKNAAAFGSRYRNRPMWDGKPTCARVLIWAEQGFGDCIQMLRFVREVRRRCPNVVLEVQPELVRLCMASGIEARPVGGLQAERWDFDIQCSLLSLPLVLDVQAINWLMKDRLRAPWLTENLALPNNGPRVGLCWKSSSSTTPERIARQMTDEQIKPLTQRFDFVSLQREHMTGVNDWADTAVIVNQLDLVIAVDTGIAHLAAALGKPVWLMLAVNCDARWLQKRTDSPWYSTARLFRQTAPGNWASVLDAVSKGLSKRGVHAQAT